VANSPKPDIERELKIGRFFDHQAWVPLLERTNRPATAKVLIAQLVSFLAAIGFCYLVFGEKYHHISLIVSLIISLAVSGWMRKK
jgi:hypothetical protein